jgi:hypothetical protein
MMRALNALMILLAAMVVVSISVAAAAAAAVGGSVRTAVHTCDVVIAGNISLFFCTCSKHVYYNFIFAVAGGSLSAFAAAIIAANVSKYNNLHVHTCLLEPTDWPGTLLLALRVIICNNWASSRRAANCEQCSSRLWCRKPSRCQLAGCICGSFDEGNLLIAAY